MHWKIKDQSLDSSSKNRAERSHCLLQTKGIATPLPLDCHWFPVARLRGRLENASTGEHALLTWRSVGCKLRGARCEQAWACQTSRPYPVKQRENNKVCTHLTNVARTNPSRTLVDTSPANKLFGIALITVTPVAIDPSDDMHTVPRRRYRNPCDVPPAPASFCRSPACSGVK